MGCGASKKVSAPQGNVTFKILRLESAVRYASLVGVKRSNQGKRARTLGFAADLNSDSSKLLGNCEPGRICRNVFYILAWIRTKIKSKSKEVGGFAAKKKTHLRQRKCRTPSAKFLKLATSWLCKWLLCGEDLTSFLDRPLRKNKTEKWKI